MYPLPESNSFTSRKLSFQEDNFEVTKSDTVCITFGTIVDYLLVIRSGTDIAPIIFYLFGITNFEKLGKY